MNIEVRIRENAALVNETLERLTAAEDADFKAVLDAQRYSLLSPRAKRIRPFLVLEVCRLLGGREETALHFAAALEMVHTYSLIHDDLPAMDNDDLRRGRPTCHKVFGEATAILAGDGLLTAAFGVLSEAPLAKSEHIVEAVRVLSRAAGSFGMIGGQVIDLRGERERLPLETLLKLHRGKTGALIVAAAELGALAAGISLDDPRAKAAAAYAAGIGLAFQIVDDVLDVTADTEAIGKNAGSDSKQNKTTFITYYTPSEALAYANRVTVGAKAEIASLDGAELLLAFADYLIDRKC